MSGVSPSVLGSACALAEHGFAVHWLRPRSKAPLADNWSALPVNTPEMLRASWRDGVNVGIRLGEWSKIDGLYPLVIDMDIRVAEQTGEAQARLERILPTFGKLPSVISGSGGESRHFYAFTDRPFRSRKLAHSGKKFTDKAGKSHWTWEIELFGTGKQVAAPPSIHPDTGKPYVWERAIDFEFIDIQAFVAADTVMGWGVGAADAPGSADDDDFAADVHRRPLNLTDEEIQGYLNDLSLDDYCEDHQGWIETGMTLHHQYEGSAKGLEVWRAFSKKSAKFNEADLVKRWESFRGRLIPVRMPTLIKAAGIARLEREHDLDEGDSLGFDEVEKDPEIAELLGDVPSAAAGDDIDAIGTAPVNKEWRRLLDLNEEGIIKPTLHNVALIIEHDVRSAPLIYFNEFVNEIMQRGKPGVMKRKGAKPSIQLDGLAWHLRDPVNGDVWTDPKDAALRGMIEAPRTQGGYGIKVAARDLSDAANIVAYKRPYHPVREYLDRLKWDGKPRAETLFIKYLGAPDDAYHRDTARLVLLGAVARVYEPGHKFDFVPILKGKQGKGKSTFIKTLGKSWFTELHGDFADRKKMIEKMQGAWICELPELSAFAKSVLEEIKAFISATDDKDRLAYDARAQVFMRQSVFFGSTNNEIFLKDDTGNRRFWPITVIIESINTTRLAREVDQIWAEAVALYRAMRQEQPHGTLPLYLQGEALRIAVGLQDSHRMESAEEILAGKIMAFLERPVRDGSGFDDEDDLIGGPIERNEISLAEIWVECLGRDFAQMTIDKRMVTTLGMAMQKVPGWVYAGRPRIKGYGQQRVYKRI